LLLLSDFERGKTIFCEEERVFHEVCELCCFFFCRQHKTDRQSFLL
jgi:hypothetical protein